MGKKATRNIIYLESAEELKTYLDGGTIKSIKPETGQKIVAFEDYILGTAIATKDGLKSQFPRAHRTGTIIFPE
jgi:NOL1/NOP2/fmu family ribosome biogenesis protein